MNKVQYDLGVITDIDLRGDVGATSSSFGIKHKLYAIGNYYDVFKDDGNVGMCAVFKGLADVTKYPVYLHCTHGMDRTGIVCFILEAILGISEEDLVRDYQLSALYYDRMWSLN